MVQIKIFNLIIKSNLHEFKVFRAKVIQLPNPVCKLKDYRFFKTNFKNANFVSLVKYILTLMTYNLQLLSSDLSLNVLGQKPSQEYLGKDVNFVIFEKFSSPKLTQKTKHGNKFLLVKVSAYFAKLFLYFANFVNEKTRSTRFFTNIKGKQE